MTDLTPNPDSTGDDGGAVPGHGSTEENTPRWVKVFGIIGFALVLLMLVSLLTGHGPGHHMSPGHGRAGHAQPAGHTP